VDTCFRHASRVRRTIVRGTSVAGKSEREAVGKVEQGEDDEEDPADEVCHRHRIYKCI